MTACTRWAPHRSVVPARCPSPCRLRSVWRSGCAGTAPDSFAIAPPPKRPRCPAARRIAAAGAAHAEMDRNVTEASTGSGNIATTIGGVAAAARSTTESVAESRQAAGELTDVSSRLQVVLGDPDVLEVGDSSVSPSAPADIASTRRSRETPLRERNNVDRCGGDAPAPRRVVTRRPAKTAPQPGGRQCPMSRSQSPTTA